MKKSLHIKIVDSPSSKLDMDTGYGVLKLPKAASFSVVVEEYEKETKALSEDFNKSVELSKKRWDERSKAGWSAKKLLENWNANEAERLKSYKEKQSSIEEKYKNVNWTWILAPKKLDPKNLLHNESFSKGVTGIQTVNFPEVLEGGGLAYLEAFFPETGAEGKKPYGIFVRAIGKPSVIRTEWTDMQDNPIPKGTKVCWGSHLKLHIYTSGLYGQELEIALKDKDTFILDSDDDLSYGGSKTFMCEVDAVKANKNEEGKQGVAGLITENEDKVKRTYIQKSVINVWVDYSWIKEGGNNIKIYSLVKSTQTGKFFENFERNYLEVAYEGKPYNWERDSSNKPVLIGQIETNIAAYHPCLYKEVTFNPIPESDTEKSRVLFKEQEGVSFPDLLNIPIICPDVDHLKDYSIELKQLETTECIFTGKKNDHKTRALTVLKSPENFKNINASSNVLNFKAAFNYHPSNDNLLEKTSFKMLEYIWPVSLPRDNSASLDIMASTCRYSKQLKILVYPDVKWTLDFRFGMKGPEQYTHTNLPNYPRNDAEDAKDPKSRYSDAFSKSNKAGRINKYGMEKRANGMELEFQLVLKAEYNKGEEIELADKYAQKIKKFLELLLTLKEGLDRLTNIDKINSGHKTAVKGLGKILKSPIVGTIDYPAISIGGKWQAAIKEDTNEVYTDGKLMVRFNPLLKGDISLDIIAAVSYVPAFGQAVKAIEIALNTAGAELNFMLTLFGQVNVEFEYALAEKGGSNLNLNGEIGLRLSLSAKAKISLNAVVFSIDGEIQAEAYAVTSIKPKASIGHDNKGTFVEAKCDFMGINIVCIITAKGKNNQIQYKDTYNILDREDNFVKGKGYIIEA